jgi:hypothetical protein
MHKEQPIILAFYVNRLTEPEFIKAYSENINAIIQEKGFNMIAFFLPTDGDDRLECVNPILLEPTDMDNINKIINDISKAFDIPTK